MEAADNGDRLVEGETIAAGDAAACARWNYVSPGYFEAMGTRMVAGRDVTWSDIETGSRSVVISEDFARELAAGARGRARSTYPVRRDPAGPHGAR